MKKQLLPIALLFGIASYAQVGIGTPLPNNSAQLEVVSTDKGVLIPRVALTSTTDIATITNGNVESLIVFNTNVAADVTQGYYYWFNNKWNRLLNQDEDSDDQTLDLVGTILSIEDGNSVDLGPAFTASETLTTFVDNGDGTLTYTDENGVATTINLTAAVQAVETTTNLTQNAATGEISYTNENGVVQNANVVSTDAGNVITAGSDGGAYLNTSATNTSEVTQAAGHSDAKVELEKIVVVMKKYNNMKIEIRAFADSRGGAAYNQRLSSRRAASVKNYLLGKGISSSRLVDKGFGETQLLNDCGDNSQCSEAQHQVNRRTEFIIIEK